MENTPSSPSKLRSLNKWITTSALGLVIVSAVVGSFAGWLIPILLTDNLESEVIYSRIEKDSIFKDSFFGDIPFKAFRFDLTNIGDLSTDQLYITLNSFPGMDLGYDPNLIMIGNVSGSIYGTQLRNLDRRIPLVPNGNTWIELSMFQPAYDSLNMLFKAKYKDTELEIPSIHVEYTEGISGKIAKMK